RKAPPRLTPSSATGRAPPFLKQDAGQLVWRRLQPAPGACRAGSVPPVRSLLSNGAAGPGCYKKMTNTPCKGKRTARPGITPPVAARHASGGADRAARRSEPVGEQAVSLQAPAQPGQPHAQGDGGDAQVVGGLGGAVYLGGGGVGGGWRGARFGGGIVRRGGDRPGGC